MNILSQSEVQIQHSILTVGSRTGSNCYELRGYTPVLCSPCNIAPAHFFAQSCCYATLHAYRYIPTLVLHLLFSKLDAAFFGEQTCDACFKNTLSSPILKGMISILLKEEYEENETVLHLDQFLIHHLPPCKGGFFFGVRSAFSPSSDPSFTILLILLFIITYHVFGHYSPSSIQKVIPGN